MLCRCVFRWDAFWVAMRFVGRLALSVGSFAAFCTSCRIHESVYSQHAWQFDLGGPGLCSTHLLDGEQISEHTSD